MVFRVGIRTTFELYSFTYCRWLVLEVKHLYVVKLNIGTNISCGITVLPATRQRQRSRHDLAEAGTHFVDPGERKDRVGLRVLVRIYYLTMLRYGVSSTAGKRTQKA